MKSIGISFAVMLLLCSAFAGQPNVIVVMTDDQGYGELSCHGNPVLQTPNLDNLHGQSIRFTDYHAAPMCTPTRGQLLTGLDAARNGAINVSSGRTLLRAELPTMADYFASAGYRTGIFGKWHLGDNYPFRPQDRGFQESLWFPSSHINSVPDRWNNDYFDDIYIRNGKREKYSGYCTDVFFREAMNWMENRAADNQPFLVYLPTNAPHSPHWAPEEDRIALAQAFEQSPLPDVGLQLRERLIPYLAMIRNIDTNMGHLLGFLEESGLAENTILVFTSDNGSTFGHLYFPAGMRGKKTELWEGGHRVPLFVRWPGGNLGKARDIDGLTQSQDLLPTLMDLCGIERSRPFDGISLAPVLKRNAPVPEDRMLVINYSRMPFQFEYPSPDSPSVMRREGAGILWKRWRLLNDRELYNLDTDPLQQKNVLPEHPEIASRMRQHLDNWWQEVEGIANEPQRVVIGHDKENPTMLTACEWLDVFVDLQKQVREGVRKNSWWELEVAHDGEYELELRRWPRESGLALDAPAPPEKVTAGTLAPGVALPIARARMLIGDTYKVMRLKPGARSAKFTVNLKKGPVRLHTWFDDANRNAICGAYYVYVKRKSGTGQAQVPVLIDSDANNETDDQHAIAYALFSDDVFDVKGITVNTTRNGGLIDGHFEEAARVAQLCGKYPGVPILKGANGSFEEILPTLKSEHFDGSEAVDFIIQQAKQTTGEKLVLLPIGKLTNIALALAKDPSIIPKVRVVWLGSNYPERGEYNQNNDLSSVRYLMDCPVEFEMVVVRYGDPSGTWDIKGFQQEIFDRMPGRGPHIGKPVTGRHGGTFHTFGDYSVSLYKHANQHGDPPFRSLFDVGAVAVVKNPEWADRVVLPRPQLDGQDWQDRPDNPMRMVLWENFDSAAILEDFYQTIREAD